MPPQSANTAAQPLCSTKPPMLKPAKPPANVAIIFRVPAVDDARPGGANTTGIDDVTKPKAPPNSIIARHKTSIADKPTVNVKRRNANPVAPSMSAAVAKTRLVRVTP